MNTASIIADPADVVSIPQAAVLADCDQSTVWRWARAGRISCQLFAGRYFLSRSDVLREVQRRKARPAGVSNISTAA